MSIEEQVDEMSKKMWSIEEQVDEIAKTMCLYHDTEHCYNCCYVIDCHIRHMAVRLYKAGYRKQKVSCEDCIHNKVCAEINSLKCRKDFIWYDAEYGCPYYSEDGEKGADNERREAD